MGRSFRHIRREFGEQVAPLAVGLADDFVIGALAADVVIGGDRGEDRNADRFSKGLRLAGAIVLVDDEAAHAHIAAELAEIFHRRADVVGDIERLQIVRADHDHLLAHVAGDGQAEAAADHVAEEVEEHIVEAPLVEAQLLEQFEAVDDATSAAAPAHFRPAQLHGVNAIALKADIADGDLLARELLLRGGLDDRWAGASAKEQRGRVALGVAADQQHLLALLGHHVGEVGEGEALANAALAIDRDDLRLLGGGGGHRIGLGGGFSAQEIRLVDGHDEALQSRTILRQDGSLKAVG